MLDNKDFREWIRFAENDIESAEVLSKIYKPKIEIACYLCHQSAEKALKAYLIFHNIEYKLIHNLSILCSDCQEIDNTFSMLNKHCFTLNRFSNVARYPSPIQVGEIEMKQGIKLANEVLNFVKEKINKEQT